MTKSHFSSVLLIYSLLFNTGIWSILGAFCFFSATEIFQASCSFPFFAFRTKYILVEFEILEEKRERLCLNMTFPELVYSLK